MITGVELRNIAEQAYNDGVGGYDPWYDTIAAVVRALEPEIEKMIFRVQEGTLERPAALIANGFVEAILGDGAGTREGWPLVEGSDKAKSETSPASFCEWALQKKLKRLPYAYIFKKDCDGLRSTVFAKKKICHHCGKPIKFMAGETAVTAVGEDLSPSSGLSPAATIDEDVLIEFVRDWNYSGYPYDLNFARKLKQKLLEAGYKTLPREPTLEMIGAAIDCADCLGDIYRAMWDAAK